MANLMDTLYDVIFHPAQAMRDIAGGRKLKQAFVAFLLSILVPFWAFHTGITAASLQNAASVMLIMQTAGSLVLWFFGAAVFALTAELFGGKGSPAGLFAAMGFIHIPRLLVIPVWAAAVLTTSGTRAFLLVGAVVVTLGWTLYLELLAIKGSYDISGAKAVLVMLFPLIVMLFIGMVAAVIVGVSLLSVMPAHWF